MVKDAVFNSTFRHRGERKGKGKTGFFRLNIDLK